MSNKMTVRSHNAINDFKDHYEIVEKILSEGDLSKLSTQERTNYYLRQCESLGLNPLTRPFDYIKFNTGKISLYAKKDCTEQLRKINLVSIDKIETKLEQDIYIVTAYASSNGRSDVSTGAVYIKNTSGDALANAYMKAETKAKRRVTLSICGLGILDETEIETIANAKRVTEEELNSIENNQVNYASTSSRVLSKLCPDESYQEKEAIELATEDQILELNSLASVLGVKEEITNQWLSKENVSQFQYMKKDRVQRYIDFLKDRVKEGDKNAA